jgi:3-mercaptopyruvate sulfurtransferase SseA
MRLARMLLSVLIALLMVSGTFLVSGAHAIQQDELTHPVAIHAGTCDDFDPEPRFDLGVVTPEIQQLEADTAPGDRPEGLVGFPAPVPVASLTATISATFGDIFTDDEPHVLVVHQMPDLSTEADACGELGGLEVDGRIVLGLRPVDDSGFAGVAVLDEDDAGFLGLGDDEVNVTVYLLRVDPAAEVEATTPEPAAVDEDAGNGYAHEDWFVDLDWLETQVDPATAPDEDAEDLVIVAVIPRERSHEDLLPGTSQFDPATLVLVDTSEDSLEEWRLLALAQTLPLGQSIGTDELHPDHTVLMYDDGTLEATALWWALDYLGHEDKQMINGGLGAWHDHSDVPLGNIPPADTAMAPAPGELPDSLPGGIDSDVLATIEDVEAALEDPDVVLVDARSPDAYAAGHVPGAVNIPAGENVDSGEIPTWAEAEQLRELYAEAGVAPDTRVIAYGDEGFSAHVTYFTLRLLGYEDVAVYPGGWVEWSQYPALPRDTSD